MSKFASVALAVVSALRLLPAVALKGLWACHADNAGRSSGHSHGAQGLPQALRPVQAVHARGAAAGAEVPRAWVPCTPCNQNWPADL